VAAGGYVLRDPAGGATPGLVLVGTGSEVHVCLEAADLLDAEGLSVRVVSLPSWDLFAAGGAERRAAVLPPDVPTLAVEAAASFGWDRYADASVSIDHFGASAPGEQVLEEFGFTPEHVAERARQLVAGGGG
jgi:transketolase